MAVKKTAGWTFLGIAVFLLLWEAASRVVNSYLLLPGPFMVLVKFFSLLKTRDFFFALTHSFLRVLFGMALSVPLGVIMGIASGLNRRIYAFARPFFSVISATPVLSIILIAFLWFGQERTPVFTAFLIIFPVMAANTIAGIRAIDPALKELFASYSLNQKERLLHLYIPSIVPFILGGMKSSLSLCWKVVAASEVLVQPLWALGTGMQRAKAQLETPELFAWTMAAVIAAALSELAFSLVIGFYARRRS